MDVRKELFDLMVQDHDKYLVDTELWDIITLCQKPIKSDLRALVERRMEKIKYCGQYRKLEAKLWKKDIEQLIRR